jgi:tRNA (cytidine/uridine-2'-O-)-methyltransferase
MQEGFVIREPREWFGTAEDDALHLVLVEPEIPGNTGNIGRLCAGADIWLHLVRPLGFELDNSHLERAGLDYWPHVKLCVHENFGEIEQIFPESRLYLTSKRARQLYTTIEVEPGAVFVFGAESTGLDDELLQRHEGQCYRLPINDKVRSLNLANSCAIVTYEALRQLEWSPLGLNG